jgi:hypothetical protein
LTMSRASMRYWNINILFWKIRFEPKQDVQWFRRGFYEFENISVYSKWVLWIWKLLCGFELVLWNWRVICDVGMEWGIWKLICDFKRVFWRFWKSSCDVDIDFVNLFVISKGSSKNDLVDTIF